MAGDDIRATVVELAAVDTWVAGLELVGEDIWASVLELAGEDTGYFSVSFRAGR